jgi:hypothetical protein
VEVDFICAPVVFGVGFEEGLHGLHVYCVVFRDVETVVEGVRDVGVKGFDAGEVGDVDCIAGY